MRAMGFSPVGKKKLARNTLLHYRPLGARNTFFRAAATVPAFRLVRLDPLLQVQRLSR
jgi:hypothetical protein